MIVERWKSATGMEFMEEAMKNPPMTAEVRGIVGKLQENIKKLSEDERNKEANMEELENHMGCLAANLTRRGKGSWGW